MKLFYFAYFILFSIWANAQSAVVEVSLTPVGSFKIKSNEVRGFAHQTGALVEAKNILVGLKNLQTGIPLRDTHTKKHLEVEKYPDAVLVTATGKGGKGEGIIKIKGIEKKFAGTFKIEGQLLTAIFPLKLSDFKIDDMKYMGVGVDDAVKITVTVPIKK